MTPPRYTPEADLAIRSELLSVEAESPRWTDAQLARLAEDCGLDLLSAADPNADLHYLDTVLLKERKRAESLKGWVWILAFTSVCLLVAFILTARSAMR